MMNQSVRVAIGGGLLLVLGILGFQGGQKSQQALYNNTRASVLFMLDPSMRGGGTGFVVRTPSGASYTMTNAHVCRMTDLGYVVATDGSREPLRLPILSIATDTDLCILPAFPGIEALDLADARDMYEHINVVGHPLLMPTSIASGYVNLRQPIKVRAEVDSKTGECQDYEGGPLPATPALFGEASDIAALLAGCVKEVDADWSDAKTYPGNSGSPVVNDRGEVVGVLFAGNSENFSFIIPLDRIKHFLKGY